jgi:ApaG protein
MIQHVTRGIKISVTTKFEGSFFKNNLLNYAFSYLITIENKSRDIVQLLSRHWEIIQTNQEIQNINGDGVLGKKPIVNPGSQHKYSSWCLITSTLGSMSGEYTMINLSTAGKFRVIIPSFKLNVPFLLN